MGANHLRVLGGIYEGGSEFACLIDTQCTVEELPLLLAEDISRLGGSGRPGGRRIPTVGSKGSRREEVKAHGRDRSGRASTLSQSTPAQSWKRLHDVNVSKASSWSWRLGSLGVDARLESWRRNVMNGKGQLATNIYTFRSRPSTPFAPFVQLASHCRWNILIGRGGLL